MDELIELRQHENVVEVALNRPKAFNAFNLEMISELANVLMRLSTDSSVKGIALTGRGKAFCAGGDINGKEGLNAFIEKRKPVFDR